MTGACTFAKSPISGALAHRLLTSSLLWVHYQVQASGFLLHALSEDAHGPFLAADTLSMLRNWAPSSHAGAHPRRAAGVVQHALWPALFLRVSQLLVRPQCILQEHQTSILKLSSV